jgi:enoyl-CoA hydratase/carnithine racemase
MAYDDLLYEVEGPVATITLNRPDQLNALTPELEDAMHAALDEADEDPRVRAIILTGAGRAFCAGFDVTDNRAAPDGTNVSDYILERYDRDVATSDKLLRLWHLRTPVIAAVNGWAMGGGFWYQLACDITIASDRAVFAQPEVRHTSNSTFLLAALCGWKVAHRFALTGDHMDAQEALRVGLVNEVVPHDELSATARRLAERIAKVPLASVQMSKAITAQGLLAAGVYSGMLVNVPHSAIAHSAYGPSRERLDRIRDEQGLRSFLEARDGAFQPEPFGPRSRPATPEGGS